MGPTALLPLRRKACCLKSIVLGRVWIRTLGPVASTLTTRPPRATLSVPLASQKELCSVQLVSYLVMISVSPFVILMKSCICGYRPILKATGSPGTDLSQSFTLYRRTWRPYTMAFHIKSRLVCELPRGESRVCVAWLLCLRLSLANWLTLRRNWLILRVFGSLWDKTWDYTFSSMEKNKC
jgi:hypothetical protein